MRPTSSLANVGREQLKGKNPVNLAAGMEFKDPLLRLGSQVQGRFVFDKGRFPVAATFVCKGGVQGVQLLDGNKNGVLKTVDHDEDLEKNILQNDPKEFGHYVLYFPYFMKWSGFDSKEVGVSCSEQKKNADDFYDIAARAFSGINVHFLKMKLRH